MISTSRRPDPRQRVYFPHPLQHAFTPLNIERALLIHLPAYEEALPDSQTLALSCAPRSPQKHSYPSGDCLAPPKILLRARKASFQALTKRFRLGFTLDVLSRRKDRPRKPPRRRHNQASTGPDFEAVKRIDHCTGCLNVLRQADEDCTPQITVLPCSCVRTSKRIVISIH